MTLHINHFNKVAGAIIALVVAISGTHLSTARADEKTLNVYSWSTYFAENTMTDFETRYGVKVVLDTYASNEELLAKLQAGNPGYDVIVPSDYVVQQMLKADLLDTIDLAKLPNFTANAAETFKNPPYDPENKHCVAYQWGTTGIGYNAKRVGAEITGWKDLFTKSGAGRVALINNARDVLLVGLLALGKDPNSVDRADLEAARDFILQYKSVIGSFHDEDGQTRLLRGDADAVQEFNGDIFQVQVEAADIQYVIPVEGTQLWVDNLCVPKGAQNKALAEQFLNYIYEPQVAADISNFTSYATPNQGAIDAKLIDAAALDNPLIYPPEEVFKRLVYLKDIGEAQTLYDEIFADLKAAVGQ